MNAVDDAKQRILDSAKACFLEQGYKKTTIRQIVQRSGLLIGSIYHYFENKEDIFNQLFINIFDQCDQLILQRFGKDTKPSFRFALMCAIMLQAAELNSSICELYYEGLTLHSTAESHARHVARWVQENLGELASRHSEEERFARALAVNGVLRAMLYDHYFSRSIPLTTAGEVMIQTSFSILCIGAEEAGDAICRLRAMKGELVTIAEQLAERSLV